MLAAMHNPMPRQEIISLASLGDAEAMDRLANIAEQFGKVQSISLLSNPIGSEVAAASTFLVSFTTDTDASLAARELQCQLYGYTSVIVSCREPQCPPGSTEGLSPADTNHNED